MIRAAAVVALALFASVPAAAQRPGEPGDFDFYVLSLSWSPAWCATDAGSAASPQCGEAAESRFVAHGLWPQYFEGYPEYCGDVGRLPRRLVASMLDIMPDRGLVAHQWRKHGSCSGLAAEDYFATTRAAFARVKIPPALQASAGAGARSAAAVEAAFMAANPGLDADEIALSCRDGLLREVRICLDRALDFLACAEIDARGCREARLGIPAAP
ncbi:MAG TPA: ribonuclease T2 [Propylenella sp.]